MTAGNANDTVVSFTGGADLAYNFTAAGLFVDVPVAPQLEGELDGDGFVGIADLNIVLGNWNTGTPPGDVAALIPEPGSLAALGLLLVGPLVRCHSA